MNATRTFFDEIVAASGLNALVAPFTIRRVLIRADVRPEEVTPADLERLLPRLREALAVFLRDDELAAAVAQLEALTR